VGCLFITAHLEARFEPAVNERMRLSKSKAALWPELAARPVPALAERGQVLAVVFSHRFSPAVFRYFPAYWSRLPAAVPPFRVVGIPALGLPILLAYALAKSEPHR
jgi:hypothetical protein